MAAVEITVSGTLYDKLNRTTQQVVLIGDASLTGLGVGGGPIQPPSGEGKPPGTWGGAGEPFPTPPINLPPGGKPPGTWGGAGEPFPTPPIEIPPKPEEPINPPVSWKPLWTPTEGWVVVGVINPEIPHPTPSGGTPPPAKK